MNQVPLFDRGVLAYHRVAAVLRDLSRELGALGVHLLSRIISRINRSQTK